MDYKVSEVAPQGVGFRVKVVFFKKLFGFFSYCFEKIFYCNNVYCVNSRDNSPVSDPELEKFLFLAIKSKKRNV